MRRAVLCFVVLATVGLMTVRSLASNSVSLNTTSMTFSNQPLGTTSAGQNLIITNTGTTTVKVTTVTVTYPFLQNSFSKTVSLNAGQTLTIPIYFFPTAVGNTTGSILLSFSNVANKGVSLSGSGASNSSYVITNWPTLANATQGFLYSATLATQGGAGNSTYSLTSGQSLPSGLTLSSAGVITGTLSSTVATGTYFVTVQATDQSSPAKVATATLYIPAYAATGASCNNIVWNVSGTTTPQVPISDLGTGTYGGEEGGLYANGSDTMPSDHDSYGVGLATGIQPLDSNGNPSPTGKYAMISIGLSATQQPFIEFQSMAKADPSINKNLVVVNGAQGGATAKQMADLTSKYWSTILNSIIPSAGITTKQIVVAWVNDVDGGTAGTFPSDMTLLQSQLETIANNLYTEFPNIKIAYYSSFSYAGYSNGVANLNNEPYAYESGFAVKNAIQDQLNGNTNLNFNPALGPVVAPWMAWGPYYWANGMTPRSDGLTWDCPDFKFDGTHASVTIGRPKIAGILMQFLKATDTSAPWFLAPVTK